MSTGRSGFNLYLLLALAAGVCGCHTSDKKKDAAATLRVHMEVTPDAMDFSSRIEVFRNHPIPLRVDKSPFLTEAFVSEAKIIGEGDVFDIEITFVRRGSWLLEEYTTTNPGKHYAIFSEFGPGMKEHRWLAAPIIPKRISNGVITFTPDATREEAQQIVDGLNAVAKKVEDKSKW